jgi:O-antigen/teichoic acid export membrane protein
VPIVLIANLFYGVFFNLSVWYKLTDRTRNGAVIALIGASITLLANILLIPVMGYTGAAWAHLACYAAMMIISYFWGKKVYPIPYKVKRFLLYLILALGLYFISVAVHPNELLIRLLFNALLLAVFVAVAIISEHRGFRATQ